MKTDMLLSLVAVTILSGKHVKPASDMDFARSNFYVMA